MYLSVSRTLLAKGTEFYSVLKFAKGLNGSF